MRTRLTFSNADFAPTVSAARLIYIGVFQRIWVALGAVGLRSVASASANILQVGNGFKMDGANTGTSSAKMVKLHTIWHWAYQLLIRPFVSSVHRYSVVGLELSVSSTNRRSDPIPTMSSIPKRPVFINFLPESFFRSPRMGIWHWYGQSFSSLPLNIMAGTQRTGMVGASTIRNDTI